MPSFQKNFDKWSDQFAHSSLDGLRRQRIYLLRHSDVNYFLPDGNTVPDSTAVPLTDNGIEHAKTTGKALADLSFDRVIASGYLRTVQTCEIIMQANTMEAPIMELMPDFVELRGDKNAPRSPRSPHPAYSMNPATSPGGIYNGGELFFQAQARASNKLAQLLKEGFNNALIVAHGGINRLIMSWALKIDTNSSTVFEQDPCCINILDLYTDELGLLIRGTARSINYTAYDSLKLSKKLSTLETMCVQLSSLNDWDPRTMQPEEK